MIIQCRDDGREHYGIDTGSYSFPYVARWVEDTAVFTQNLDEVQKVAMGLIQGIDQNGGSSDSSEV